MFGRDEKVSSIRLTAVQYIILGVFLILTYGLWRLQVMQSDVYTLQAFGGPHVHVAVGTCPFSRRAGKFWTAMGA